MPAIELVMRKKNIMLTIWLALPITIVSLLMVWIFYSLDKERLMADAPPVGAGAGDTGNANALGQWLAGRDADAISRALDARREGRAIDPREWPGGVELRIWLDEESQSEDPLLLTVIHDEQGRYTTAGVGQPVDGWITKVITQENLKGSFFVVCSSIPIRTPDGMFDDEGNKLRVMQIESQIPQLSLQVSDPMTVEVRMGSVYEESP